MINSYGRAVIYFVLFTLLLSLLPGLAGIDAEDFFDDDVLDDDSFIIHDIPFTWLRIDMHHVSILSTVVLSMFVLFVVYLGGRSKHRRFNDRTIDATVSIHVSMLLRTARRGAVFNFLNGAPDLLNNVQPLTEGGTKL